MIVCSLDVLTCIHLSPDKPVCSKTHTNSLFSELLLWAPCNCLDSLELNCSLLSIQVGYCSVVFTILYGLVSTIRPFLKQLSSHFTLTIFTPVFNSDWEGNCNNYKQKNSQLKELIRNLNYQNVILVLKQKSKLRIKLLRFPYHR